MAKSFSNDLTETGDTESGIRLFRSVPADPEEGTELIQLAEMGDIKTAKADLQAVRAK